LAQSRLQTKKAVMKCVVLSALAVVLSPAAALAQTAAVARSVYLRLDPSTAQPPVRLLTPEDQLTLLEPGAQAGFYHVRTARGEEGWVWARSIRRNAPRTAAAPRAAPARPAPAAVAAVPGSEAGSNPACPPVGTHKVNGRPTPFGPTTDAGLRNLAKRHVPASATPTTLALADFVDLQHEIDVTFADAAQTRTQFTPTRDALRNLHTTTGAVSEGDLVQLAAFVTAAHQEMAESVNCGGTDGTDIHVSIGPPRATEFDGLVAEMIPQLPRPAGWDVPTLTRLHTAAAQVLLVGGLTYDNEHLVNSDPQHPKRGQPERISLWEIHPITDFLVCAAAGPCDPAHREQWTTLTDWASQHP
jgi:Bacterial SH3 domain